MSRYEGFEQFFAAQRLRLSRTALFLTGDPAAAEDLLQEALTRTAQRWSRVSRQGDPTAYVRQVMLNDVRSSWRHRQRVAKLPVRAEPANASADFTGAVVSGVVLLDVLRQLAPRQRAVLYLRYYEDMGEAETARLLGCSVGTVKSQAHDALARLRRLAPELAPNASETESEVNE